MMDRTLLLLHGAIMISSLFVFYQFARLVFVEVKGRHDNLPLSDGSPLSFSLWLCLGCAGLFGTSITRVHDGLVNEHLGGHTPGLIALFAAMIWLAQSGFHWLASRKRKLPWRIYVVCMVTWVLVGSTWPLTL